MLGTILDAGNIAVNKDKAFGLHLREKINNLRETDRDREIYNMSGAGKSTPCRRQRMKRKESVRGGAVY